MTNKKHERVIEVEEYYYNPNLECTCGAIFADTHRGYCKRRKETFLRKRRVEVEDES